MTYGDVVLMFIGAKPVPKDLDPRIKGLTISACLEHKPNDEIIFDEDKRTEGNELTK